MNRDKVLLHAARQVLGETYPDGKFDSGGRWYPSPEEKQECCKFIRAPSIRFPYSILRHCRTIKHVARKYEVKEKDLRIFLKMVKLLPRSST